jgi:type VI secretion system secreted protein VgrG
VVPYRPQRITPRPKAWGLESAVVTGPGGEEIHVDEFGRIKVHFYWDRENPVDDTASCWMRVQQLNTSGAMILPRVGWEVHVAFMDGDPDRPVAIHKAYNQETMPPYAQPGNKTQSSMQSSTSPGGGSTNEIRMQDGNGGMEWFLHASRDLAVVVAHDENETIDVNAEETVGEVMQANVGGDETGTVGGNQSMSVTTNATMETVGARNIHVGGMDDWGVTGNYSWATKTDRTETITGMMNVRANKVSETFNANHKRSVGAVQALVSVTAIAETVGGNKTENVTAAKAIITPTSVAEQFTTMKSLTCAGMLVKSSKDVAYAAKLGLSVTAAGIISIKCGEDFMVSGDQVRVTSATAEFKGGGGTFKLTGSITIDADKFGGKGGPALKIKGKIDYKD